MNIIRWLRNFYLPLCRCHDFWTLTLFRASCSIFCRFDVVSCHAPTPLHTTHRAAISRYRALLHTSAFSPLLSSLIFLYARNREALPLFSSSKHEIARYFLEHTRLALKILRNACRRTPMMNATYTIDDMPMRAKRLSSHASSRRLVEDADRFR